MGKQGGSNSNAFTTAKLSVKRLTLSTVMASATITSDASHGAFNLAIQDDENDARKDIQGKILAIFGSYVVNIKAYLSWERAGFR